MEVLVFNTAIFGLEADAIITCLVNWLTLILPYDVNLFVYFFAFLKDVLAGLEETWLESLHELDHKLIVLHVGPLEILDSCIFDLLRFRFAEREMYLEQLQKVLE